MSPKPVSRELAPAGTSAHSRLYVQVTSPKRTSGPRRYAVVSTPTCDLNRTGCSSGITCEMAILRQLATTAFTVKHSVKILHKVRVFFIQVNQVCEFGRTDRVAATPELDRGLRTGILLARKDKENVLRSEEHT